MGNILKFEIGCRRCKNLVKIGIGTYCCFERVHMDDSPVIPIAENNKTDDWFICSGESYYR